jgi:hypothetical protein
MRCQEVAAIRERAMTTLAEILALLSVPFCQTSH